MTLFMYISRDFLKNNPISVLKIQFSNCTHSELSNESTLDSIEQCLFSKLKLIYFSTKSRDMPIYGHTLNIIQLNRE